MRSLKLLSPVTKSLQPLSTRNFSSGKFVIASNKPSIPLSNNKLQAFLNNNGVSNRSVSMFSFNERKMKKDRSAVRWFSDATSSEKDAEKTAEDSKDGVDSSQNVNSAEGSSEAEKNPEQEKIEKLEQELKDAKEQLLRVMAESENARKRSSKEIESSKTYAIQSFAKQLLDVADNLKRAVESVPKEELESGSDTSNSLNSLFEGVEMTQKELQKVLNKNKVFEYGEVGDQFDPHLHNAMFNITDPEKPKGTVGQVIKTGYKFHDRVLRPADVGTIQ